MSGGGRLVVVAAEARELPGEWTAICEAAGWPPMRVESWDELAALDVAPEVVMVAASRVGGGAPNEERWRRAATRWVALRETPTADDLADLRRRGYAEVVDLAASPALVLGPLHRAEELREVGEAQQRLLDESLTAYEDIRWLDRIREGLRLADLATLAPRLVRMFAEALGEAGGCLWRPDTAADGRPGGLVPIHVAGVEAPAVARIELHALPQVADLLAGKPVLLTRDRTSVWIPLRDGDMLLALVEIPRKAGRATLLNRELVRLRMLVDWLVIAMRNSLELEQLRSVLRARYGDFFSSDAFRQHVDKALVQARRYRRPLAVIGLTWLGADADRDKFFRSVFELLRDADVFEEPRGDRARIFLPETGYLGGVQFLRRVRRDLAQKFGVRWPSAFQGVVAGHPWAGDDSEALLALVDAKLDEARRLDPALRALRSASIETLPDVLAPWSETVTLDPNVWADIVFHLVQEITLQHPDDSRLLLFLGAFKDSVRTFAPLFDFPARWDRILVAAGLDAQAEPPESHIIRIVRDDRMLQRWYALLDRPDGAVAAWSACDDGVWRGGVCTEPQLVQVALNRFEDQYMLHHRWVAG